MKIHIASDLHFEHQRGAHTVESFWTKLEAKVLRDRPDAIVLAGDIDSLEPQYFRFFKENIKRFCDLYPAVLYVPGNHEFFGTSLKAGIERIHEIKHAGNFRYLAPGIRQFAGTTDFTGGTMWYPDSEDHFLKRRWIDYRLITNGEAEIHEHHEEFRTKVLERPGDIMVTHMMPTNESIAPQFAGSPTNVFFVADGIEEKVGQLDEARRPKLWIHGHTHSPFDFKSRLGFRVYCNPHAYPHENSNPRFWDRLLVDTEDPSWYLKTFNGGSNDD